MPRPRKTFPRVSAFLPAAQAAAVRPHAPRVLFSYGFRPFFLGAAAWAIVSVLPCLGLSAGCGGAWHAHEALFGFGGAVVAGFLLTAVPNWTGRRPLTGLPLAALFALWCARRAAFLVPASTGGIVAAVIDGAFLPVLVVLTGRDVILARNRRNLKTVALVGLLAAANVLFHAGHAPEAIRLGVAALVGLMMLVGGRMTPSFTRDLLARRGAGRLPPLYDRFDAVAVAVAAIALAAWVVRPEAAGTGLALLAAGLLQALRVCRWRGLAVVGEPLLFALHAGYGFVALGFVLAALAEAAAPHAWTAGALGTLSLAVMCRAARGHTGRPLTASAWTAASLLAVIVAALLRIAAALAPGLHDPLLAAAAVLWALGFGLFLAEHARMLATAAAVQPADGRT